MHILAFDQLSKNAEKLPEVAPKGSNKSVPTPVTLIYTFNSSGTVFSQFEPPSSSRTSRTTSAATPSQLPKDHAQARKSEPHSSRASKQQNHKLIPH